MDPELRVETGPVPEIVLKSRDAGARVWESLLWPDPQETREERAASRYALCLMLQDLYETMVDQPRREWKQVQVLAQVIAALAGRTI